MEDMPGNLHANVLENIFDIALTAIVAFFKFTATIGTLRYAVFFNMINLIRLAATAAVMTFFATGLFTFSFIIFFVGLNKNRLLPGRT